MSEAQNNDDCEFRGEVTAAIAESFDEAIGRLGTLFENKTRPTLSALADAIMLGLATTIANQAAGPVVLRDALEHSMALLANSTIAFCASCGGDVVPVPQREGAAEAA